RETQAGSCLSFRARRIPRGRRMNSKDNKMNANIVVETPIIETTRVQQVRGMFDLAPAAASRLEWNVNLSLHERAWNLGLIVGPSGCGKTTIARHLFVECSDDEPLWSRLERLAVVDAFPDTMPIKDIVALL